MNQVHENLADNVIALLPPIIVIWSGTLATIPDGWSLCDGSQGTPDLTDKFILGAKPTNPPGSTGGASSHYHSASGFNHWHDIPAGNAISAGSNYYPRGLPTDMFGVSDQKSNFPPYYALAYIMKN